MMTMATRHTLRSRIAAWFTEGPEWDAPSPPSDAESLAELRAASAPLLRVAGRNTSRRHAARYGRLWREHRDVAERLGYCERPGCEARVEPRWCAEHDPTRRDDFDDAASLPSDRDPGVVTDSGHEREDR